MSSPTPFDSLFARFMEQNAELATLKAAMASHTCTPRDAIEPLDRDQIERELSYKMTLHGDNGQSYGVIDRGSVTFIVNLAAHPTGEQIIPIEAVNHLVQIDVNARAFIKRSAIDGDRTNIHLGGNFDAKYVDNLIVVWQETLSDEAPPSYGDAAIDKIRLCINELNIVMADIDVARQEEKRFRDALPSGPATRPVKAGPSTSAVEAKPKKYTCAKCGKGYDKEPYYNDHVAKEKCKLERP